MEPLLQRKSPSVWRSLRKRSMHCCTSSHIRVLQITANLLPSFFSDLATKTFKAFLSQATESLLKTNFVAKRSTWGIANFCYHIVVYTIYLILLISIRSDYIFIRKRGGFCSWKHVYSPGFNILYWNSGKIYGLIKSQNLRPSLVLHWSFALLEPSFIVYQIG